MNARNSDPIVGQKVADRYELISLLGKGGMGVVYRAVHIATGRHLAVKLLSRDADDGAARRFLREARIAAKVSHPNLVDVIDVGKMEEGGMFLALELLEGEALSAHLRRKGSMRPEDALDALVPIIDALGALHAAGVVHRDIKPSNIFLSLDGTARIVPKLLDLGVSKPLDPGEALTETGMMLGTPHYMSPEQATGAVDVGVAADIWAMGVVLFEALSGDRPFSAETIPGLLHKIATDRPPRLCDRMPKLPASIGKAIDIALAYDPSSRHASAADLADALVEGALEAGWTLTCRMPTGPRISLMPFAPDVPNADPLTPMLGSSEDPGTPVMGVAPAAPPSTPSTPSKPTGPLAVDKTRSVSARSVASLTPSARRMADVPGTRMTPIDETGPNDRPLPNVEPKIAAPIPTPLAEDPPSVITSPSTRVKQLSTSPWKIALPIGALALGVVVWIVYSSMASGPDERARPATIASGPAEDGAADDPVVQAAIDAGAPARSQISASAEVVAAETVVPQEARGPRRRRPPPQVEAPVQEPPPPPEAPRPPRPQIDLGTNDAPIIQ
jgi:serine/threonine protein kinase